jgi:LPS O-antigen subunit length determinant protein (WzzB/FepE family)
MKNNQEINLVDIFKKIYVDRRLIAKFSLIAAIIGIIYSLSLTSMYTSSTTFIPQLSSKTKTGNSTSGLSGLASLAGINLGSMQSSAEFPPSLYPQVVQGAKFKLDLLASKINFNGKDLTIREYYKSNESTIDLVGAFKKYTINLPSTILSFFRNEEIATKENSYNLKSKILKTSYDDKDFFKTISNTIALAVNNKEGFITLSSTDRNKEISAQITIIAQSLLQEHIISYKNQSSKEVLEFSLKQYNEKKSSFEALQDETAIFVDKNQNITSSLYSNKLKRLENEVNIAQSIVQQLASQVEQAKLQVNKSTPVFTIIKPVTIPFERSAPKRTNIVIVFTLIGFVFSVIYVLFKDPANNILKLIKT